MKYKVGDKVRVRSDLKEGYGLSMYVNPKMLKYAGNTYRITKVGSDYYVLDLPYFTEYRDWHWTDDMLEDTAKPIYRNGDIVQTKNGNYYLVWNAEEKYGVRDHGHVYFEEDGDYSVVKVWEPDCKAMFTFRDLHKARGKLLWEKKTVKEMTVAEIEAELGYSVKVVKE